MYWHFENKDAIIIALWERGAGPLSNEMTADLQNLGSGNLAGQFRKILLNVIQRVVEDQNVGQAMHIIIHYVEITETRTPLRNFLKTRRSHMYETFYNAIKELKNAGGLKSDLSIDIITGGLMSYIYGLIDHHLEPDGFLNLERDHE